MSTDRDRITVRRALRAGGAVGAVVAVAGAAATLATGIPGGAVVTAATLALGALVASAWLLLAALLDLLAGDSPGRRRWVWTAVTTLLAMLGPFFVVGALSQVATIGPSS